jgi:radical SAM superfamily enzyme YgiQ (UPF0313 family)
MKDKTGSRQTRPKLSPRDRINREQGAVVKDWGGKLPIALIYPNSYFLGMSNLGIQMIYSLLNSYPDIVCERVFWEKDSSQQGNPPVSIESGRPLTDFAVLAFSISYELDYFNVISILKAAGIPLHAADRDENYPLIIAGGPCIIANPAPLVPFFDCFGIGEAEAIFPFLLPAISENIGGNRQQLLKDLSALPGIYAPTFTKTPVTRQWVKTLDDYPVHSTILTPDTELGDLYLIEVERGCNWGCRFCLVNTAFAPMRIHSPEKILEQAKQGLPYRKRIGLMGPAISDHPRIVEILSALVDMGAEVSMSSLRIGSMSDKIIEQLSLGKVQTVTIAPEAGSQRLRQMIKKGICQEDILQVVSEVAERQMKQLKLYFIIGLPTENDEDVQEIVDLALVMKKTLIQHRSKAQMTINIAPFTPKAGTPFQWLPMTPLETLNHRIAMLKRSLPPQGIKINAESPAWSQIHGALAMGDEKLGEALTDIGEISLAGWKQALARHQIDVEDYIYQQHDTGRRLPWSMIHSGQKPEHLEHELAQAMQRLDTV